VIFGDIKAPDERDAPIDDAHLSVIAVIKAANYAAPRRSFLWHSVRTGPPAPSLPRGLMEYSEKDASGLCLFTILASEPCGTDPINQESYHHPSTNCSGQDIKEPHPGSIGGKYIELYIDAHRCRIHRGGQLLEELVTIVNDLTPLPHLQGDRFNHRRSVSWREAHVRGVLKLDRCRASKQG
jgi:hypothetical protein